MRELFLREEFPHDIVASARDQAFAVQMQNAIEPQMHGVAGEAEKCSPRNSSRPPKCSTASRTSLSSISAPLPEAAERYRNPEQTDRRQRDCDGRRGGIGAVRVTNGSDARHRRVDAVCRAEGARHRRVGAAVLWAPIAVAALPVAFAFGPQAKALVPTAVSVVAGLVTQTGCATACRGAKLIQSATDKPVKP